MKVRIVYRSDRSVVVIHPAPKSKREDETESEWLERVFGMAMQGELEGLEYDDVDESELPQSRENREAWTGEKGKGISIDENKINALTIVRQYIYMIDEKQKEMAIDKLKEEGKLPQDY